MLYWCYDKLLPTDTEQADTAAEPVQPSSSEWQLYVLLLTPLEDKNRKEILCTIKNVINLLFPESFQILLRMKETLQYM